MRSFRSCPCPCPARFLPRGPSKAPSDLIKSSNREVQDLLSKHEKIDAAIESELFRIIDGVTDFKFISRNTLDPFCGKLTEAQCWELGAAFQRLIRGFLHQEARPL